MLAINLSGCTEHEHLRLPFMPVLRLAPETERQEISVANREEKGNREKGKPKRSAEKIRTPPGIFFVGWRRA